MLRSHWYRFPVRSRSCCIPAISAFLFLVSKCMEWSGQFSALTRCSSGRGTQGDLESTISYLLISPQNLWMLHTQSRHQRNEIPVQFLHQPPLDIWRNMVAGGRIRRITHEFLVCIFRLLVNGIRPCVLLVCVSALFPSDVFLMSISVISRNVLLVSISICSLDGISRRGCNGFCGLENRHDWDCIHRRKRVDVYSICDDFARQEAQRLRYN